MAAGGGRVAARAEDAGRWPADHRGHVGAGDAGGWVTASDVAQVAYCARAYRLQRVERRAVDTDVAARLRDGVAAHRAHGRAYALQQRLLTIGGVGVLIALAVGVLAWVIAQLRW